jgi:hypothetical protein
MAATYAGENLTLHDDDRRGVTYLYPNPSSIGNITGTVTTQSGTPISGVKITIANLPASATTLADGSFTIAGVPKIGTYSVSASAKGYTSETQNGIGVPANLVFELESGGCVPRGPGYNCP